jgi:serine/threonine-protein phosphatase CPPED1
MKRLLLASLVACLLVAIVALSGGQRPAGGQPSAGGELHVQVEERNPWTNLRLNNGPDTFSFAIVSDRTGGHRARIFSQAVEQLNLLQPQFVISVGDLIEGYTEDPAKLAEQWKEFQGYVGRLQMPFFLVPGNHDVSNAFQKKDWKERFGRRYYHFVYRDVLFLLLDSDDTKGGFVGKGQIAFVQKTLKENAAVRWTVVALHKPLWVMGSVEKNGWLEVEKALAGRPYTVFCGHVHRYQKFVRNGQNYYQLATTGGGSRLRGVRYGEFDHVVWVTMKKDGPVLANLMLDGIYPEDLKKAVTDEEGVPLYNRKPVHAVRGKVHFEGTPTPDARVVFYFVDAANKKLIRAGDALVEADGSFTLSTYTANDGAPVGEYVVTVTWPEPAFDAQGRPGPNRLPGRYAGTETSPLRVQVRSGTNEFTFNLTR